MPKGRKGRKGRKGGKQDDNVKNKMQEDICTYDVSEQHKPVPMEENDNKEPVVVIVDSQKPIERRGRKKGVGIKKKRKEEKNTVIELAEEEIDMVEDETKDVIEILDPVVKDPQLLPVWTMNSDGSIPCAPDGRGGCGCSILALQTLFEDNWLATLTTEVEKICSSCVSLTQDDMVHCDVCDDGLEASKDLRQCSNREQSRDNHLYCPTRVSVEQEGLAHFQKHWMRGEPVVVRNVLEGATGLSWEPLVMWRAVRETTKGKFKEDTHTVHALDCLDWCEVI